MYGQKPQINTFKCVTIDSLNNAQEQKDNCNATPSNRVTNRSDTDDGFINYTWPVISSLNIILIAYRELWKLFSVNILISSSSLLFVILLSYIFIFVSLSSSNAAHLNVLFFRPFYRAGTRLSCTLFFFFFLVPTSDFNHYRLLFWAYLFEQLFTKRTYKCFSLVIEKEIAHLTRPLLFGSFGLTIFAMFFYVPANAV